MSQPLPLSKCVSLLGGLVRETVGPEERSIYGACNDSREVQEGWLFIAIAGASLDGRSFVPDALERGATAIISPSQLDLPDNVPQIVVSNAYHAAGVIAERFYEYPASSLRLYGVTGTNGKTTCTSLVRYILSSADDKVGLISTIGYHTGEQPLPADRTTPSPFELQELFQSMVKCGTRCSALEISSHALDQERLGTAQCEGAIFTNLTGDHCDYHGNMENYFHAKSALFTEHLRSGGVGVLNIDDAYAERLYNTLVQYRPDCHFVTVGNDADADYRIVAPRLAQESTSFGLKNTTTGNVFQLHSPLIGFFNIMNIAESAALALNVGISETKIEKAVSDFPQLPGRLERFKGADGVVMVVDYAHTDDALQNVLKTLCEIRPPAVSVVFGCGGERDATKRPRMGKTAALYADKLYITSDNPRSEELQTILNEIVEGVPEGTNYECIPDRREAIQKAARQAVPGELILVAGKGHETSQEIKGEKVPFSDVEEVKNTLQIPAS